MCAFAYEQSKEGSPESRWKKEKNKMRMKGTTLIKEGRLKS